MRREMDRRSLLASLAGVGTGLCLSGCVGGNSAPAAEGTDDRSTPTATPPETSTPGTRPTDGAPDGCPVTTLPGFEPPDEPTVDAVEEFAAGYEEAYRVAQYSPSHPRDTAAARVESSTPVGHGVAVTLDVAGWNDVTMVVLEGEPHPPEGDPPGVSTLPAGLLRETARRAAEEGERVHGRSWEGGSVRDAVPDGVHEEYRSLPGDGDGDGRYVVVGGTTVRLVIHANELHKATIDGRVRYYVDSRVVRRQSDPAADPRSGELLECR